PQGLDGLALPAEFNTAHFFDPAFIAGLVNEVYAEGRPALPGDVADAANLPPDAAALARGVPEALTPPGMPAVPTVRPARFGWQDPRISLDGADALLTQTPQSAAVSAEPDPQGYYFLTPQQAPTARASAPAPVSSRSFEVEAIRRDFPILHQTVHGKPLIWLD